MRAIYAFKNDGARSEQARSGLWYLMHKVTESIDAPPGRDINPLLCSAPPKHPGLTHHGFRARKWHGQVNHLHSKLCSI